MLCRRIASPLLLMTLGLSASDVFAQVVTIGFGQGGSVVAVPLSPWVAILIAGLLAVTAIFVLRKRRGTAALLVALSLLTGALSIDSEQAHALVSCGTVQPVGTGSGCLILIAPSPTISSDYQFTNANEATGVISVLNSLAEPVTITSIHVVDGALPAGWLPVDPSVAPPAFNVNPPKCVVGLALASTGKCSLYLQEQGFGG